MNSWLNVPQMLGVEVEQWRSMKWQMLCALRVALPCQVVSFDAGKQTVSVQPLVQERIAKDNIPQDVDIPVLQDVPIVVPRAGGFSVTFPIQAGDECLVIFADSCIDAWWQSGGRQPQMDRRRHDLSDGFAVFGVWSQPRKLSSYSEDRLQIRSDDGQTYVELQANTVTVYGPTQVNVHSATKVDINGAGHTTIEGKDFLAHHHTGVQTGSGQTGGVA